MTTPISILPSKRGNMPLRRILPLFSLLVFVGAAGSWPVRGQGLVSSDLSLFRSVGAVALSPDGRRIAYTITMRDRPGRPYSQLWIMDLATQNSSRVGGEKDAAAGPMWSPDGKSLAFFGSQGGKHGLLIARADGSDITFLAEMKGTNSPLPGQGKSAAWSPDSKQIAFVSSVPGEAAAEAEGDPRVITRYLYKPDAGEGMTRFNDNQRLHIFVVDLATRQVRQLTQGETDEHSIDWSPDGKLILFASNREPNQDEFFNYDLFTLQLSDNSIHRLTATESNEYDPVYSPDGKYIAFRGTRRGLTDRETTMEDTHVWVMNADGSRRREIGAVIDNRQGAPQWTPDSRPCSAPCRSAAAFIWCACPFPAAPRNICSRKTARFSPSLPGRTAPLLTATLRPRILPSCTTKARMLRRANSPTSTARSWPANSLARWNHLPSSATTINLRWKRFSPSR